MAKALRHDTHLPLHNQTWPARIIMAMLRMLRIAHRGAAAAAASLRTSFAQAARISSNIKYHGIAARAAATMASSAISGGNGIASASGI